MVSPAHEFLVELFRRRPELARELLRMCTNTTIPGDRIETGSIDLTLVAPAEYRADAVAVTRDVKGIPLHAVVVEVQLGTDPDKSYTWPVYVAALRARLRCPVTLLVIAPDPSVAAWAARRIVVGKGMSLKPRVVSFDDVPRITESIASRAQPELSILSAFAHEEMPIVGLALEELQRLPEDQQDVYFDLLERMLPKTLRRWQVDFKNYQFKGETALKAIEASREEGREAGREEGRRQVLRDLIAKRFGVPLEEADKRLVGVSPSRYQHLVDRIMSSPTIDSLFDGI